MPIPWNSWEWKGGGIIWRCGRYIRRLFWMNEALRFQCSTSVSSSVFPSYPIFSSTPFEKSRKFLWEQKYLLHYLDTKIPLLNSTATFTLPPQEWCSQTAFLPLPYAGEIKRSPTHRIVHRSSVTEAFVIALHISLFDLNSNFTLHHSPLARTAFSEKSGQSIGPVQDLLCLSY